VTLKDVLAALTIDGSYAGKDKKRMGKGTKIPGVATDVHVFDTTKGDFIDTAAYTNSLKMVEDEDSGAQD
jgi:hypothetical protein